MSRRAWWAFAVMSVTWGASYLLIKIGIEGGVPAPDVAWLRRKLPKGRIAFGSNSREAQARMCAAGIGLAVLPAPLGDAMPELEAVDLGDPPPGRDVWVGFHQDLRRVGRLRALVDETIAALAR